MRFQRWGIWIIAILAIVAASSLLVNRRASAADTADLRTAPITQGASSNPNDISKIGEEWAKAWSAKQLEKVMAFYAPDAVFLTADGQRITGQAALRAFFEKVMASVSVELSTHSIITERSGNLAYDSGDFRETIHFIAPGSSPAKTALSTGDYLIVCRRGADGKWLIVEHMWTGVTPEPK
jgi:uncharacterized protein (TIGR02246 family)